jgi:hypothetical protein
MLDVSTSDCVWLTVGCWMLDQGTVNCSGSSLFMFVCLLDTTFPKYLMFAFLY